MSRISLMFRERFEQPMLERKKVVTCRTRACGNTGDIFLAFKHVFEIQCVSKFMLDYVRDYLYSLEGVWSPAEFQEVWTDIHPKTRYVGSNFVYAHWFHMMGSVDAYDISSLTIQQNI